MIEIILGSLAERDLVELLDQVCRRRAVTRDEVCGEARTKAVVRARHEVWWLLRNHPEVSFSFQEIGRLFGRDHATVLHGVRAHAQRVAASMT
jgi:chromosomal replication initiation ATPase DnaA